MAPIQPLVLLDATPEVARSERFRHLGRRGFMRLAAAAAVGSATAVKAMASDRYDPDGPLIRRHPVPCQTAHP